MILLLRSKKQQGFTLLEVLISIVILAFISVAIYQAMLQAYRLKDSLGSDADFNTAIRIAFSLLERDIALIYSPLNFEEKPAISITNPQGVFMPFVPLKPYQSNFTKLTKFWSPAVSASGLRPSRFQGDQAELSFITCSHMRIYRDSLESDFSKVVYNVVKDPIPDALAEKMFVKTEDPAAFAMDDFKNENIKKHTVLRGIDKMVFTYYQRDGKTWKKFKSWDSDKSENNYLPPDMIEINVVLKGLRSLTYEAQIKLRPEIPLNGIPLQF